ncbi:hypothetical protein V6N11_030949 [Hibiscus sabdariffa]|uniref:Uncharacterized protein n=1 Tax=Hibiscus sabdariffa TaxID=183260 RepID=A0ABR2NS30_9ROSI
MVSAKNDCQSRNNKSQIGSGRASPTLSSLRIQASVKSSFTLLGNEIQDTTGKQKTFLARHCVLERRKPLQRTWCALEVSIDFLAKGSNLVSVFGSSIDTLDLTLFPADARVPQRLHLVWEFRIIRGIGSQVCNSPYEIFTSFLHMCFVGTVCGALWSLS